MRRSVLLSTAAATLIAGAALFATTRTHDATEEPATPTAATAPVAPHTRASSTSPTLAGATTTTASEITRWLDALARDPSNNQLSQEAFAGLVAELERDPAGALAVLEPMLAEADGRAVTTRTAIGAMAQVGTPEIQKALVSVVVARADDQDFAIGALPAIGLLAKPTVETEAALRTLTTIGVETTRNTAHLSLGIMASKLADGDQARAQGIIDGYAARLAAATSTEDRRRWLGVLGNAATPAAAAVVSSLVKDPEPAIRARAVEALRRVAGPEAEALQLRALADGDASVRASAAWSLSYRMLTPGGIRTMLDRLAIETDERAGLALLDAIWARKSAGADVVTAVRDIAEHHASGKVRERARKYLAPA